jgi:hypothetical protein
MATRRHDARTNQTPRAMVPAQVMPSTRCPECGFLFFGMPGTTCEICRAKDHPEPLAAPETPTTDPDASVAIARALGAQRAHQDAWRQDMATHLSTVERHVQDLLQYVVVLREAAERSLPQGGESP